MAKKRIIEDIRSAKKEQEQREYDAQAESLAKSVKTMMVEDPDEEVEREKAVQLYETLREKSKKQEAPQPRKVVQVEPDDYEDDDVSGNETAQDLWDRAVRLQNDLDDKAAKFMAAMEQRKALIEELKIAAYKAEVKEKNDAALAAEQAAKDAVKAAEEAKAKYQEILAAKPAPTEESEVDMPTNKKHIIAYGYWVSEEQDYRYVENREMAEYLTDKDVIKVPAWQYADKIVPMSKSEAREVYG